MTSLNALDHPSPTPPPCVGHEVSQSVDGEGKGVKED